MTTGNGSERQGVVTPESRGSDGVGGVVQLRPTPRGTHIASPTTQQSATPPVEHSGTRAVCPDH